MTRITRGWSGRDKCKRDSHMWDLSMLLLTGLDSLNNEQNKVMEYNHPSVLPEK